jgi:hypothetical protein
MLPNVRPVAVTLHDPEERVHVEEEKETLPVPLCDHVTFPVGLLPVTVAVHGKPKPMPNDVVLHERDMELLVTGTLTNTEPELSRLSESPL